MISFIQIILIIKNLLKSIISLWRLYSELIISYLIALNSPNNSISYLPLSNYLSQKSNNQKLFKNLSFKDINGYYVYQGFEIL